MPLYCYVCPVCGIEIEERRPVERIDEPLNCPLCGALCTRQVNLAATFFTRGAPPPEAAAPQRAHPRNCPCCLPPPKGNRS